MPNPAAVLYDAWRRSMIESVPVSRFDMPETFAELPPSQQTAWFAVVGAAVHLMHPVIIDNSDPDRN